MKSALSSNYKSYLKRQIDLFQRQRDAHLVALVIARKARRREQRKLDRLFKFKKRVELDTKKRLNEMKKAAERVQRIIKS